MPGGGRPAQDSALRKDGLSMVSMPSIIMEVLSATVPSNATFRGSLESRAFSPERSPDSAARKSLAEIEPSTRWPRQSNWPVAAKEREIEGQASDRSMSSSFSSARLPAST